MKPKLIFLYSLLSIAPITLAMEPQQQLWTANVETYGVWPINSSRTVKFTANSVTNQQNIGHWITMTEAVNPHPFKGQVIGISCLGTFTTEWIRKYSSTFGSYNLSIDKSKDCPEDLADFAIQWNQDNPLPTNTQQTIRLASSKRTWLCLALLAGSLITYKWLKKH